MAGHRGRPSWKQTLKPRASEAIFCLLVFSYTLQPVHLRIYINYTEVERGFKVKSRPNEVQQSICWALTKMALNRAFFVCVSESPVVCKLWMIIYYFCVSYLVLTMFIAEWRFLMPLLTPNVWFSHTSVPILQHQHTNSILTLISVRLHRLGYSPTSLPPPQMPTTNGVLKLPTLLFG